MLVVVQKPGVDDGPVGVVELAQPSIEPPPKSLD